MDEINELQATVAQKRMFFALCKELNLDGESTKEAAKRKFRIESFANVSKTQLSEIIDALSRKVDSNTKRALVAFIEMCSPRAFFKKEIGTEYPTYPEYVSSELLKYFIVREKKLP